MPKTLPADLTTAMDTGVYDPYLKALLYGDDPDDVLTVDVLAFKIMDTTAECTIPFSTAALGNTYFALERGVLVAGLPVTIRTVYYVITSFMAGPKGIILTGHVLPPAFSSFDGAIMYEYVIDQIIGNNGLMVDPNITYEDDQAWWLFMTFYPPGRNLTLGNVQTFFNVLAQKFMIYAADNCDGMFVFQATSTRAKDYDVVDELLSHERMTTKRRLMWRDEEMSLHYSGLVNSPIHNLGFIDSQQLEPTNVASPRPFKSSKLPVHLKYRTGDVVKLGTSANYFQGRIKVTEVFDEKSNPSWHMILEPLVWFANTEGGAIPSTIEAAAPYTPLHVGYFNHVLSASDNNVQAAMETLDDHKHGLNVIPPNPTATSDFLAGVTSGSIWQWAKKTLAETLTILGKGAANGIATLGPNAHVPENELGHDLDIPGNYASALDEHFFALPAWTGGTWINDPTGTNGAKGIAAPHFGRFMMDDTLPTPASIYYRPVTVPTSKTAYMVAEVGYQTEVGIHLDDGTLTNYFWLGLVYTSVGFCKIVKRVCTGGVVASTDLATNLPVGLIGLRVTMAASISLYMFKDLYITQTLSSITSFFTPTRIGFYFLKTATGAARYVGIIRWTDSFI